MNLDRKAYLGGVCSWLTGFDVKKTLCLLFYLNILLLFCGLKFFVVKWILSRTKHSLPWSLCRVWKLRNFSSYLAISWKLRMYTHRNKNDKYMSTNFLATFYELSLVFSYRKLCLLASSVECFVWKLNLTWCEWSRCLKVSVT